MKLLRWAVGGASVYVIYKYSIGRKSKGEDVFVNPEKEIEKASKRSAKAKKSARAATDAKLPDDKAEAAE